MINFIQLVQLSKSGLTSVQTFSDGGSIDEISMANFARNVWIQGSNFDDSFTHCSNWNQLEFRQEKRESL